MKSYLTWLALIGLAVSVGAQEDFKAALTATAIPADSEPGYAVPASVLAKTGYSGWPASYHCQSRGCFQPLPNPPPYTPTALNYIQRHPHLKTAARILAALPAGHWARQSLAEPFNGTLFCPTDKAFHDYFHQFAIDINDLLADGNKTAAFFEGLMAYHVLPDRALFASKFVAGQWYNTAYYSVNGKPPAPRGPLTPHQVGFGAQGSWKCKSCKKFKYYLLDEQDNAVSIYGADKFISGGGVLHIVNSVLQPNDIFPSVKAALTYNKLTALLALLQTTPAPTEQPSQPPQMSAGHLVVGPASVDRSSMLALYEATPGTLLAPTNEAFRNATISNLTSSQVLQYHMTVPQRKFSLGFNDAMMPVSTLLLDPAGSSQEAPCYKLMFMMMAMPPMMPEAVPGVHYGVNRRPFAPILLADVQTPLQTIQVVFTVLSPYKEAGMHM